MTDDAHLQGQIRDGLLIESLRFDTAVAALLRASELPTDDLQDGATVQLFERRGDRAVPRALCRDRGTPYEGNAKADYRVFVQRAQAGLNRCDGH